MSYRQADRLDNFLEFLYCSDGVVECDLQNDLTSCGVNLDRVQMGVAAVIEQIALQTSTEPSWLNRAKEKRARFETMLKARTFQWTRRFEDSRSLVEAALAGNLGGGLQSKAQVFFRNQSLDQLSESDMKSFLEDLELLEMLQDPEEGRKEGSDS